MLKVAIGTAKKKCSEDFCKEIDQDPWDRPYKAVMKGIKPRVGSMPYTPVCLDRIVRHLFPEDETRPAGTGLMEFSEKTALQDISEDELVRAAKKISIRKAPGCVPYFPAQWKLQRLVLLPKGNKPPEEPSSHRSLCLLDIAGSCSSGRYVQG